MLHKKIREMELIKEASKNNKQRESQFENNLSVLYMQGEFNSLEEVIFSVNLKMKKKQVKVLFVFNEICNKEEYDEIDKFQVIFN